MDPKHAPTTLAWYPAARAYSLPPVMLETDARLSCQHLENRLASIIAEGSQCPVYLYSNTLAYKPVCRKQETTLLLLAEEVALPIVSRVGVVDDTSSQWYQKGVVMDLGCPLDVTKIFPAERHSIAQQMITLVSKLHEKGVIHGDIRPGNFVKASVTDGDGLRMVGFSSARMADDSDLSLWLAEEPRLEYTAPSRVYSSGPSSLLDDYFALAVSIWAVFAGEDPVAGLFSSNEGHAPDVTKITDDGLFCLVVDILERGGLRLDSIQMASRRGALEQLNRCVSFPLSLFDVEPDDLDQHHPHPIQYPELCHLNSSHEHDLGSMSDYGLEWLLGQQSAAATSYDCEEAWVPVLEGGEEDEEEMSQAKTRRRWPFLRVDTKTGHSGVEEPVWSGVSTATSTGATIVPTDRFTTKIGPTTVPASESDEGYMSMSRGRSAMGSVSGTLSDGSESAEDDYQKDADAWLYASSPPLSDCCFSKSAPARFRQCDAE